MLCRQNNVFINKKKQNTMNLGRHPYICTYFIQTINQPQEFYLVVVIYVAVYLLHIQVNHTLR